MKPVVSHKEVCAVIYRELKVNNTEIIEDIVIFMLFTSIDYLLKAGITIT
jgi:hypothetical protein